MEHRQLLASATDVRLQVDPDNGLAQMVFNGTQAIAGYEIVSSTRQLVPAAWRTMSSRGYSGWGVLAASTGTIAEGSLSGSTSFSGALDLGRIFAPHGTRDLTFMWIDATGHFDYTPAVEYVALRAATTAAIASSPNPSAAGEAVTLTAVVSAAAPLLPVPGGSVQFLDGTTPLGSAALDATGRASLTLSTLSAGHHSLTAVYGGDSLFAGATSAGLDQVVNPPTSVPTATTVTTAAASPSSFGAPLTFTAAVTAAAGTPGGSVTFYDGAAALGTVALDGAARASLTVPALYPGRHAITAFYGGDAAFDASSSAALDHDVLNTLTVSTLADVTTATTRRGN